MPTWVPTVVATFVVLLVNVVLLFYFKWVPEVEKQKQHVQQLVFGSVDLWTLASFAWALYHDTQRVAPVTPMFVVTVAAECAALSICITVTLFRRFGAPLFMQHVEQTGKILGFIETHTEVLSQCNKALRLLAKDANLSPENMQKLKALVGDTEGQQDGAQAARLLRK